MNKRLSNPWARHEPNSFVFLNKNLCNFPLARDPRVKPDWRLDKKTLKAELSGDSRITFELPASADSNLKRYPTPFDINVLCALLVQAKMDKSKKIEFASYSEILRAMGFSVSSTNLRRVRSSLAFLSVLTIRFKRYWFAGKTIKGPTEYHPGRDEYGYQLWSAGLYKEGHRGEKLLPPLIDRFTDDEDGLHLTLNAEWLKVNRTRFVARVHLPLPRDAAAQNIVLCALARRHDKAPRYKRAECEGHSAKLRALCRKVGLNHSRRTIVLRSALRTAQDYFLTNNRDFVYCVDRGRVRFAMAENNSSCDRDTPSKRKATKQRVEKTKKKKQLCPLQPRRMRDDEPESMKTVFDEDDQLYRISHEEYERDFN